MFENAKQPVGQKYPRLRAGKVNGEAYRVVAQWLGLKIFGQHDGGKFVGLGDDEEAGAVLGAIGGDAAAAFQTDTRARGGRFSGKISGVAARMAVQRLEQIFVCEPTAGIGRDDEFTGEHPVGVGMCS
jgi:hypothetical protein